MLTHTHKQVCITLCLHSIRLIITFDLLKHCCQARCYHQFYYLIFLSNTIYTHNVAQHLDYYQLLKFIYVSFLVTPLTQRNVILNFILFIDLLFKWVYLRIL